MTPDLTSAQIRLVQASWQQVLPIREQAAALFYGRLFTLDPSLRALFHSPIGEQGARLMAMIDVAVRGLDDLARLAPAVQALGARHAGYGVRGTDYAIVGAALLWTLEQGLGERFTPAVREAWAAVYGLLAQAMQDGAGLTLAA